VSNQQKLPLKTAAIAASYLANRKPIIVDSKSLTTQSATCALEKNLWPLDTYSCTTSIYNLNDLIGNDFQVQVNIKKGVRMKVMSLTFSTPLDLSSARTTVSALKNLLKSNYSSN
ncbi:MAG TPA: hypothetical protein VF817_04055, partial [Patescibacteria group bacterium]